MTVQELKQRLEAFPPNAPVVRFVLNDSGQDWFESPDHLPRLEQMVLVTKEDNRPNEFLGCYLSPAPRGYRPTEVSQEMPVVIIG